MTIKFTEQKKTVIVPEKGYNVPVADSVVAGSAILPSRFNSTSSPTFKGGTSAVVDPKSKSST